MKDSPLPGMEDATAAIIEARRRRLYDAEDRVIAIAVEIGNFHANFRQQAERLRAALTEYFKVLNE